MRPLGTTASDSLGTSRRDRRRVELEPWIEPADPPIARRTSAAEAARPMRAQPTHTPCGPRTEDADERTLSGPISTRVAFHSSIAKDHCLPKPSLFRPSGLTSAFQPRRGNPLGSGRLNAQPPSAGNAS
jgi:hypothetical protein